MQLPLTLLFWINAESLRSGRYRDTIKSYHDQLRMVGQFSGFATTSWHKLPRPHAYIRLTDAEKPLLADAIDFLYDHDVMPIVQDGTQLKERNCSDLYWLLDRPELHHVPFTLYIRGDYPLQPVAPHTLANLLAGAVSVLDSSKDVVSVGFPPVLNLFTGAQPINPTFDIAQTFRTPAVVRTRDLWLANVLSAGQPSTTPGFETARLLDAFSHSQIRHIAFNRSIVTSL